MEGSAQKLRQHADHCRDLAFGHISERTRLILYSMADEFDQQARDLDEIDRRDAEKVQNGSADDLAADREVSLPIRN